MSKINNKSPKTYEVDTRFGKKDRKDQDQKMINRLECQEEDLSIQEEVNS